jgi:hypothetical protein
VLQRSNYFNDSGLMDTMVDLILGSAGAMIGMFYSAFSHHNKEKKAQRKAELKHKSKR